MTSEEQERFDKLEAVYGKWSGTQLLEFREVLDEKAQDDFEWWYQQRNGKLPPVMMPKSEPLGSYRPTDEELIAWEEEDRLNEEFVLEKMKVWSLTYEDFCDFFEKKIIEYLTSMDEDEAERCSDRLDEMPDLDRVKEYYKRAIEPLEPKE